MDVALEDRDYFTDYSILKDPYAFFEAVRGHGPIYRPEGKDYLIVTGFAEILEVLNNAEDFSAIIGLQGASAPLPFTPQGSDIKAQIEAHRSQILGGDFLVNLDDHSHTALRALVNGLFTPSRLRANEQYIAEVSDRMVRTVVEKGECNLIKEISTPFVTLVIADLLGVPPEDRQHFMNIIEAAPVPGSLNTGENDFSDENHPMVAMAGYFVNYIQDRRANPRDDILTEFANATYPDGTKPELQTLVSLAIFLFGAGQDTSAKLLGNAMRFIIDQPGLQQQLREKPSLIPAMLEEVLRLEGSTKQTARLARKDTKIADVAVPAGTKLLLALSAANRDPRRWENPNDFALERPRIKEHVGFGRGKHVCAGAPLARVEVRMILEKFLEHTKDIDLNEAVHGPRGARQLDFEPSFIIRGLSALQVTFKPSDNFVPNPVQEEPAPAAAPAVAAPAHYTVDATNLGTLLGNPAATAVLEKHFPGISTDPQIGMAKGMTLRVIQAFAPAQFTAEALDAVNADLAKLPV
jgi:cytochrome P450